MNHESTNPPTVSTPPAEVSVPPRIALINQCGEPCVTVLDIFPVPSPPPHGAPARQQDHKFMPVYHCRSIDNRPACMHVHDIRRSIVSPMPSHSPTYLPRGPLPPHPPLPPTPPFLPSIELLAYADSKGPPRGYRPVKVELQSAHSQPISVPSPIYDICHDAMGQVC